MNDTFAQAFGYVAAIAGGIAMLTVFFLIVARINRLFSRSDMVTLKGVIDEQALIDVVLKEGERICDVKLIGVTDPKTGKGPSLPYQLNHLVVFQKQDGRKYFVLPESINYMEEKKISGESA